MAPQVKRITRFQKRELEKSLKTRQKSSNRTKTKSSQLTKCSICRKSLTVRYLWTHFQVMHTPREVILKKSTQARRDKDAKRKTKKKAEKQNKLRLEGIKFELKNIHYQSILRRKIKDNEQGLQDSTAVPYLMLPTVRVTEIANFFLSVEFKGLISEDGYEIVELQLVGYDPYHKHTGRMIRDLVQMKNKLRQASGPRLGRFFGHLKLNEPIIDFDDASAAQIKSIFDLMKFRPVQVDIVDCALKFLFEGSKISVYVGFTMRAHHELFYNVDEGDGLILPVSSTTRFCVVLTIYYDGDKIPHFFLIVYDLNKREAKIYDSARNYYSDEQRNQHAKIITNQLCVRYKKDRKFNFPSPSSWTYKTIQNNYQQRDEYSCGSMILWYASKLLQHNFQSIPYKAPSEILREFTCDTILSLIDAQLSRNLNQKGKELAKLLRHERTSESNVLF